MATLTFLAAADVDYLDPGQTLLHVRLSGPVRDQPAAVLVRARGRRQAAGRTSPTASRRSPTTRRRSRSRSSPASSTRRRSTARSRPRTSSTRSSAPSARTCRRATRPPTSPTSTARPTSADQGRQADLRASRRRTTRRSSSSSTARSRGRVAAALVMPITVPVPKEYAEKFDAKSPDRVRPVRRLHRPVHGQERPDDRQGRGPRPGQADRDRPQPELGQGHGLPSRLPGLDHDRGGQRRPDGGLAPHARSGDGARCAATPASRRSRS